MTDQSAPDTKPTNLRELLAAAIYERNNPGHAWGDAHPDDRVCYGSDADAAMTVILARAPEATVQRVIALRERWLAAGPPPLGASMARWWDTRLAELHNAIHSAADQTTEK
ncbi:hypothetical protein [Streptomyces acidiscabies]|uniref:hypothetical protein n=1 Tax=Streptomyces acidiscabies TaxID=42234 RepID=UPI0009514B17|nr:hypothetical protein [Streptomyces acidiscabies]